MRHYRLVVPTAIPPGKLIGISNRLIFGLQKRQTARRKQTITEEINIEDVTVMVIP
jgi:hypothetical protein